MSKKLKLASLILLVLGLMLFTAVATGCGTDEGTTTTAATTTGTTAAAGIEEVAERANEVLASDSGYPGNAIEAKKLNEMLADPAAKDTLYVLDVRQAADYEKGHIEGAVNVPFGQWAAPDNLKTYPKDKTIVVVCYTGHTAAEVVGGLRMLGYEALALKAGMLGWNESSQSQQVADTLGQAANPVVNTPAEPVTANDKGGKLTTPPDPVYQAIADRANKDMGAMSTSGDYASNVITAAALKAKLDDPAQKDQVFLLDIRSAKDFEQVGHIEGAVNIPFKDLAKDENLVKLPQDKKIIVICYTGNTAAQATMILRLLDYDAAVLKFGSMGWSKTPNTDSFITYITNPDYPLAQ